MKLVTVVIKPFKLEDVRGNFVFHRHSGPDGH